MLDTVKLQSPHLGEDLAAGIERHLDRLQRFNIGTGELQYELTAGGLDGSYDTRVSCRIMREQWVELVEIERQRLPDGLVRLKERKRSVKEPCAPYLLVEGSVHKAMLGHNITGGPESFQEACEWFRDDLSRRLGVELPEVSKWLVRRADWAECYQLPYEAGEQFVWALNQARFPRRKSLRYGEETAAFPGRSTSVNVYHKGPEFSAHDHKRLKGILTTSELRALQDLANATLRVEVQVKAPKLRYDHAGELPRVDQITDDYLKDVHDSEMKRLIGEGIATMKRVRKLRDVRERLFERYDDHLAGLLLGTWHQLATLGEKELRRHMPPRTWYRHKKHLLDAGVTWIGADVLHVPNISSLPQDFAPLRTDPRRRAGEDPAVAAKLAPYRAA